MKYVCIIAFLIAGILLFSGADAALLQSQRSFSGSFTGLDSPTITVGGNSPPVNVSLEVSGVCEGISSKESVCGPAPAVSGIYGIFLRHYATVSAEGSCFGNCTAWLNDTVSDICLSTNETFSKEYIKANCSGLLMTEMATILGGHNSSCSTGSCDVFSCNITAYYAPCTKYPQAIVNGTAWIYGGGLLNDTSKALIDIGANSNPASKTVPGNLQLGSNLINMSALNLNKFNYTLSWTEENVTEGADNDGDGYYTNLGTLGNDCDDSNPDIYPGHIENLTNRKDDNCDGVGDTLAIDSMDNVTAYCPYNDTTQTYNCTGGWENIIITADITLPYVGCYYQDVCGGDSDEWVGCSQRNIVFEAKTNFSAKTLSAANGGGAGGAISITAKNIAANSLNTYGSMCQSSACCGGPLCGNSNGGTVKLKADFINITTINANQGGGVSGSGGLVMITANRTYLKDIYSKGGGANSCSYDGQSAGSGSGGTVVIKSGIATISTIALDAGGSSEHTGAGSGGSAKLVVDNLTLGSISANGGSPSGSGGNTRIYADNYSINSIIENGGRGHSDSYVLSPGSGGFVGIFSDLNNTPPIITSNPGYVYDRGSDVYGAKGITKLSKRTGSGFFILETTLVSPGYKSYFLKMKDARTGKFATDYGGYDYSLYGRINATSKSLASAIGWTTKLLLKLGNDYDLMITASNESALDLSNCGISASCKNITIPFARY